MLAWMWLGVAAGFAFAADALWRTLIRPVVELLGGM